MNVTETLKSSLEKSVNLTFYIKFQYLGIGILLIYSRERMVLHILKQTCTLATSPQGSKDMKGVQLKEAIFS